MILRNVHLAFTDAGIEHPDTYTFIKQFEKITGEKYTFIRTIHLIILKMFGDITEGLFTLMVQRVPAI